MSDNIVEIIESDSYSITIDTSLVQNDNNVVIELINSNTVDIINNTTVLVSRVSGLDIVGGSGISVVDNSGIYTIAVTGNFGLTSEEVDDRVSNLLVAGSYAQLNYNDNNNQLTISVTGLQPSGNYSVVGHNHVIADVSGLQTILDNKQPSGVYASGIHYHTSSDITDFNSSVSGLLPVKNISSGSGISVINNSGDFNISVTGQFGLTSEQVDDRISNLLVAGSYINLNYNDSLDSLTINVSGLQPSGDYSIQGHQHLISDVSGLQLALDSKQPSGVYASGIHSHTTSDITDFNSGVSGLLPNISGSGYVSSNFINNTYTITVSGLQPSGNYSINGHTHTSSDVTDFNSSVNGLVSGVYAPLNSPALTGVPTAPTAPSGTNNSQIANTEFVRTEISNLVNSAPSTLDTLNELAQALGSDPNFATTIASGLAQKSNIGHTHSSSEITNFNSEVSGLLPSVSGSGYVNTSFNNNSYTISVSGLQPSGNYANSVHTHVYTDITNFGSGVSDSLTTTLLPGNFINLIYDSNLDTLTIGTSGLQPSGNYSLVGHNHTSSEITDFNSSVSGLLPSISGSGYITTSLVNNIYTISSSGLQPSGNYSLVGHSHTIADISNLQTALDNKQASGNYSLLGHTHTVNDISNFNSSVSGLLPVTNILGGSNITVSQSGTNFTVAVTGSLGLTTEEVDDRVATLLVAGTGIDLNYNDISNTLTITSVGSSPSGNYALVGHSHTVSNITDFNSGVSGLLPVTNISAGSGLAITSSSGNFTVNASTNIINSANLYLWSSFR